MRSMVEGAPDPSLLLRRKSVVESGAPSTALRAVPLPRYLAGKEEEDAPSLLAIIPLFK